MSSGASPARGDIGAPNVSVTSMRGWPAVRR